MEDFWSTLKIELVFDNTWTSQAEADTALFTYIDGFYNLSTVFSCLLAGVQLVVFSYQRILAV